MECVISCGVLVLAGRSFLFDRPGRVTVQCHRCDYPRAEVRYVVGSRCCSPDSPQTRLILFCFCLQLYSIVRPPRPSFTNAMMCAEVGRQKKTVHSTSV